ELPPPTKAELSSTTGSDGKRIATICRSGKPFLVLIAPVPGQHPSEPGYFIQAAMDRVHDKYLLAQYRERMWLVVGLSFVLCSLVGYAIARNGMNPIRNISRTAERIRSTTLQERIATAGLPAELSSLAETFNSMLDRLEESFLRISQFSDDVAHELRTPI